MSFVGHRRNEMTVGGGDEPSVAGVRWHRGQRCVTRHVVGHRTSPDAQRAAGKVDRRAVRIVKEVDSRRDDRATLAFVDVGRVEYVMVAGQQRHLGIDVAEAFEGCRDEFV